MPKLPIQEARYSGDLELLERIQTDAELRNQFQRIEVLRSRSLLRSQLLSSAVRVQPSFIPELADLIARVSEHFLDDKPVEAYVFGSSDVNAFIADLSRHRVIGLSSGALSTLTMPELGFVIGHEMGHVVFGHVDLSAATVLKLGNISSEQCRLLHSWQRACEISADRAGLLFCNSLAVGANALFKTLAGLPLPGVQVDPYEFAEQWSSLADEVMEHGGREFWQLEHPFPPLRMKAMEVYWRERGSAAGEAEIARLLGIMEDTAGPRAVGSAGLADPVLARFQFWGGLYVVLADGPPNGSELEHLTQNLPVGMALNQVLNECGNNAPYSLERFAEARRNRKTKLSSAELHRIVHGLKAAALSDGPLNELERRHLHELGAALGLRPEAVDLVLETS
ncbi:M48 family peptidase [bacterium CPR1]|nr:M48 family peptidase [bacterium CPR1]